MKTFTVILSWLLLSIFVLTGLTDDIGAQVKKPVKLKMIKTDLPPVIISTVDSSTMILIPAGEFIYGISKSQRTQVLNMLKNAPLPLFDKEFPEQIKKLASYYIDKYEVTNQQYERFTRATGYRTPRLRSSRLYNRQNQPVVGIGWADAEAYSRWAGKRLPTEEEWEKAARGMNGNIWPWGNEPSGEKYNGKSQGNYLPLEVGMFPDGASPFGVMDMAGNVYEMTTGQWSGDSRVMRGGSYLNAGAYTRTTFRWATEDEVNGAEYLGFRCVMDTTMIARYANKKAGR